MKTIMLSAVIAAAIASPVAAFAQSTDTTTRAQVERDQVQFEHAAGSKSSEVDSPASYPDRTQAAEAKIGKQQWAQANAGDYGGVEPGTQTGTANAPANPGNMGDYTGGR